MVESSSNEPFICKLCSDQTMKNLCVANCIGCQNVFCVSHLVQHRRDLLKEFDELAKQRKDLIEQSLTQLNVNQHLENIDRWEYETIELVHQHAKIVKEKILSIFSERKFELKQHYETFEKEVVDKRNSDEFTERDLEKLLEQSKHLDQEIQKINKTLYQISTNELNQIVNRYKLSMTTIGIKLFRE